MKFEKNKQYTTVAVYTFLGFAALIVFYRVVNHFSEFSAVISTVVNLVMPFVLGFAFAYILNPVLRLCENKIFPFVFKSKLTLKTRRVLGVVITYLFAASALGIFMWIVIPQVALSVYSVGIQSQTYFKTFETWSSSYINAFPAVAQEIFDSLMSVIEGLIKNAFSILSNILPAVVATTGKITSGIMNFVMGIIVSIYMLVSKEKFFAQTKKVLYAILEKDIVDLFINITHNSHKIFSGFIIGKMLDSIIIGILCFIGMTIFGMEYAVLISLVVGVTNIIPFFGPFIGAVPGFLILFIVDPIQSIWFLVFILALQQFDGNILGPLILGDSIGMPAFWVIFSILFAGGLFGFVGMFIGVPLFAVIYSLVRDFCEYRLRKKNMPTSTASYASDANKII